MGKINIIIQREFNQRVRKRSFILTTILTPLLMVGLILAPTLLMQMKSEEAKTILVVDNSGVIASQLQSNKEVAYKIETATVEQLREQHPENIFGILEVGHDIVTNPNNLKLFTYESSTISIESNITGQVKKIIETEKLKGYNIDNLPQIMAEVKTNVSLQAFQINEEGGEKESSSVLSIAAAYIFGFMIYMFIFMYGMMVMQGVIEEKTSKVLEVMVSSVRPFELMMGKIIGIALVAITQFLIWIFLIFILGTIVMSMFAGDMVQSATEMGGAMGGSMPAGMDPEAMAAIRGVTDLGFLIKVMLGFIVYFIGGYLLYSAMFAAIGSAVEEAGDAQQLQLPVTIPLILAIMVLMYVMREPHSSMAVWFSMIPLTSPIIMMARIPYGVPAWQLVTSIVLLYASFLGMVWVAGKIYRVGIFMYGKKPTWKELYKWMRYKY